MAKKRSPEKNRKRHSAIWKLVTYTTDQWLRFKGGYRCEVFDKSTLKWPVIVCFNHSCALDPFLLGAAFKRMPLTFVATETLIRDKSIGKVVDWGASVIAHKKGSSGNKTALAIIKKLRKGDSIALSPSGELSWDGRPTAIMPGTGAMIKQCGAGLITYRMEGAYLLKPRWAYKLQKGNPRGVIAGSYDPDTVAAMSPEEIEETIVRDLHFDFWEAQESGTKERPIYSYATGHIAEGIERAVYVCPECGSIGCLKSKGDSVSCSCGFSLRLTNAGCFEPELPFKNVGEWMAHDREALREVMTELMNPGSGEAASKCIFSDEDAELRLIREKHEDSIIGKGYVEMVFENGDFAIRSSGREFKLSEITEMSIALATRLLFSDESGYYELKSKHANFKKYLDAWNVIHSTGKED